MPDAVGPINAIASGRGSADMRSHGFDARPDATTGMRMEPASMTTRDTLSTQAVENRWDNVVENRLMRSCRKAPGMFGYFLTSVFQLSTTPVDKPADSVGNNRPITLWHKG
ncbi:hypothetical protein [Marilutibacter maris]|uniref:hypothetical protein n=1 Tax=Marilutibacter maris TaxID=1605891 RepID=UPI001CB9BB5E|nr:hypothetical protein [Lysobacter maris]